MQCLKEPDTVDAALLVDSVSPRFVKQVSFAVEKRLQVAQLKNGFKYYTVYSLLQAGLGLRTSGNPATYDASLSWSFQSPA